MLNRLSRIENEIINLINLEKDTLSVNPKNLEQVNNRQNSPRSTLTQGRTYPSLRPFSIRKLEPIGGRLKSTDKSRPHARETKTNINRHKSSPSTNSKRPDSPSYLELQSKTKAKELDSYGLSPRPETAPYFQSRTVHNMIRCKPKVATRYSQDRKSQSAPSCKPGCSTNPKVSSVSENLQNKRAFNGLKQEIDNLKHRVCQIQPCPVRGECLPQPPFINAAPNSYMGELSNQIKTLRDENLNLNQKLMMQKKIQQQNISQTNETQNMLNEYEDKLSNLHQQALRSSAVVTDSNDKFYKILNERNQQIRNLTMLNSQLMFQLKSNEGRLNLITKSYEKLKDEMKTQMGRNKNLYDNNDKFTKGVKNLEKELECVCRESENLKTENKKLQKDIIKVKKQINKKSDAKVGKQKERLKRELEVSKANEAKLKQQLNFLAEKLKEKLSSPSVIGKRNTNDETEKELSALSYKYHELLKNYQKLTKNMEQFEEFDAYKCSCIEQELGEFSKKMRQKEDIVIGERNDLRKSVQELSKIIAQNKITLEDLSKLSAQQEKLIANLNGVICEKDDILRKTEYEREKLQNSIKHIDDKYKEVKGADKDLARKLEISEENLLNVKQKSLVQEKIIEDQNKTISAIKADIKKICCDYDGASQQIRELSNNSEELKQKLKGTEKSLIAQQTKNKVMRTEIENLSADRQSLNSQIEELEEIMKCRCSVDVCTLNEQKEIIANLENQMEHHKHEWELQKSALGEEKQKAIHAARFASQKLLETVMDFQRQMNAQKAVQKKLTKLLEDKENQLLMLASKMTSLTALAKKSTSLSIKGQESNICTCESCYSPNDSQEASCRSGGRETGPNSGTSVCDCDDEGDCIPDDSPYTDNFSIVRMAIAKKPTIQEIFRSKHCCVCIDPTTLMNHKNK